MEIEIKVPPVGETINEVVLSKWLKSDGDFVEQDEQICELESEKATFEVPAEKSGKLTIVAHEKDTLKIGDVLARIDTSVVVETQDARHKTQEVKQKIEDERPKTEDKKVEVKNFPSPAAEKLLREKEITLSNGTGKDGRITKADVLKKIQQQKENTAQPFNRNERREKMSSLRRAVSRHLVEAKNITAMLTTFNEVNMKPVMDFRSKYKDEFKEKHGVNLGFMSFFAKACCYALNEWPSVNASIDNDEIIFHDFFDISIAVSTPKGLVVPVIRNTESLSFAEIESKVADLAKRGRDNKLALEEMSGGTFTISNGGVFGSLMSTPIINIPQSAILGMHKIEERAVVIEGQIVIRPMMYVALSYDHRIIDGRESVSFLVRVKEMLEHPEQLFFGGDPVKTMLGL